MIDRAALLSEIPGLVHGFTDRTGGVSTGRFATLDMSDKWGDQPGAVAENRERVARAAGFSPSRLRLVKQVHGAEVVRASAIESGTTADALVCTREDRVVVGVLTADCVPILLADRGSTLAAAVHSGWRGTVADVVGAAVRALAAAGAAPRDLVAAIGPCIEQGAFEVGEEVAEQFEPHLVARSPGARPHVDLVLAVRAQLERTGVPADAIERVGGCTVRHPDRWYSYRRDGSGIGQMLAFVGWA